MKEEFEKIGYKLIGFFVGNASFEIEFANKKCDIISLTNKGVFKTDRQYKPLELTEDEEALAFSLQLSMIEKMEE